MADRFEEPAPVTDFMLGTLRVVFDTVEVAFEARGVAALELMSQQRTGEESSFSDAAGHWLYLDWEAVLMVTWDRFERQPYNETDYERMVRLQGGSAFSDGWIRAFQRMAPQQSLVLGSDLGLWYAIARTFADKGNLNTAEARAVLKEMAQDITISHNVGGEPTSYFGGATSSSTGRNDGAPIEPEDLLAGDDDIDATSEQRGTSHSPAGESVVQEPPENNGEQS